MSREPEYERTQLWRAGLAPRPQDNHERARERLRAAWLRMREQAAVIAGEIARDMPDFTVHDVTHLDALWEMADLILGDQETLTPCEVFVLGGAILCHDLANGTAAYPDGLAQLRHCDIWRDALAAARRRHGVVDESKAEVAALELEADRWTLRMRHAEQAARLPTSEWVDRRGRTIRLLADDDLRDELGPLIGQLAESHWFDVGQLRAPFERVIAGPTWCPREWTIDPLRIACLLRVADAAHIDVRRAPPLLYALRRPEGLADSHWSFQRRMRRPVRVGDALEYSSTTPFPAVERDAWWTAVEAITMIDRELRQVAALLVELGRPAFVCRRVSTVELEALRDRLPCEGWRPLDTRVRVGDVASLVERLGGRQLYGHNKWVPLRELVQNAADAVRARRLIEGRKADWGAIEVRRGRDDVGLWIEVEDSGIGMSEGVMTGPLLDFGTSYWTSSLLQREHPGLLARGFRSAGQFGIGFFSIFMWGRRVRVTTRSIKESPSGTKVLEFDRGLRVPPLLRPAGTEECLVEPGTRVRTWLDETESGAEISKTDLCSLVPWLCPTLDVGCWVEDEAIAKRQVLRASDWIDIPAEDFLRRCQFTADPTISLDPAPTLQLVRDHKTGAPVGRAALSLQLGGILVHEGFRLDDAGSQTRPFNYRGVFFGGPAGAARNDGSLAVSPETIARWIAEQTEAISTSFDDVRRFRFASMIDPLLDRPLTELPVLWSSGGWSLADIAQRKLPRVLLLVDDEGLLHPFNQQFDFSRDMPPCVFLSCRKWYLDTADLAVNPTFQVLLCHVANAWGVEVGQVLARSHLRMWRSGKMVIPFDGTDPPRFIRDRIQCLVHPDATVAEIRSGFEALEGWRPLKDSHSSIIETMRRVGEIIMEYRYGQRENGEGDAEDAS